MHRRLARPRVPRVGVRRPQPSAASEVAGAHAKDGERRLPLRRVDDLARSIGVVVPDQRHELPLIAGHQEHRRAPVRRRDRHDVRIVRQIDQDAVGTPGDEPVAHGQLQIRRSPTAGEVERCRQRRVADDPGRLTNHVAPSLLLRKNDELGVPVAVKRRPEPDEEQRNGNHVGPLGRPAEEQAASARRDQRGNETGRGQVAQQPRLPRRVGGQHAADHQNADRPQQHHQVARVPPAPEHPARAEYERHHLEQIEGRHLRDGYADEGEQAPAHVGEEMETHPSGIPVVMRFHEARHVESIGGALVEALPLPIDRQR